jgi:hypothetical protein
VGRFHRAVLAGVVTLALATSAGISVASSGAGCAGPACGAQPRVVVADIDTGINPYHSFFHVKHSSVTPAVLKEFGIRPDHVITLTRTGNFAADYAADKKRVWDRIRRGDLYYFTGTNIIATSFTPGTRPILPDNNDDAHGVATAAAVATANPEAIILFVEDLGRDDPENEGMRFAFTHPAVDILTTSFGNFQGAPDLAGMNASYDSVVHLGKLYVAATANNPLPGPFQDPAGQWWDIAVAGFEYNTGYGWQVSSGTLPDFLGDYTQLLPNCAECESGTDRNYGDSFATPQVAGTISLAVLQARRAVGQTGGIVVRKGQAALMIDGGHRSVTNWQIRRAFEEAAHYPTASDYDPIAGTILDEVSVPINDQAPWLEAGWGVVMPTAKYGVVPHALARLGFGKSVGPTKAAGACQFETSVHQIRYAYWNRLAVSSDSWNKTDDPYLACS